MAPSVRLHKFLADAGVASRRASEELIREGRVSVDGETVSVPGRKVDPEGAVVRVDGEIVRLPGRVYYALHKPRGYICTSDESKAPRRVIDLVSDAPHRVYTAGRLDVDSEGLVLVTNDGDFALKLTHPRYRVEKVYRVQVAGALDRKALAALRRGAAFREGKVKPARVEQVQHVRDRTEVEVAVYEGINREVRRLFAHAGLDVKRLVRLSVGPFFLGAIRPGRWKRVPLKRVQDFLHSVEAQRR